MAALSRQQPCSGKSLDDSCMSVQQQLDVATVVHVAVANMINGLFALE
jgi:hypothetical protein